jgi:hypothetical protein
MIADFLAAGVPVLLGFVTPDHNGTLFGCVVQRRKQWTLLPFLAQSHHHNPHQLPQFTLAFRPGQELTIREASGDMMHDIVACGYALPTANKLFHGLVEGVGGYKWRMCTVERCGNLGDNVARLNL